MYLTRGLLTTPTTAQVCAYISTLGQTAGAQSWRPVVAWLKGNVSFGRRFLFPARGLAIEKALGN